MVNVEKLESVASAMRTVGNLQTVVEGTGAELYGFIIKVMESVGCPRWLSRRRIDRESREPFGLLVLLQRWCMSVASTQSLQGLWNCSTVWRTVHFMVKVF